MKKKPVYKVVIHRDGYCSWKSNIEVVGTVEEITQYFAYTLECGQSWEHEKGNKKINCHPKGIASLVKNVNNAYNNSAANGYAGKWIELVGEVKEEVVA